MARNTIFMMMDEPTRKSPLKHQNKNSTWQPGQIPPGQMVIMRPHDLEHAPYRHGHLGVECPVDRTAYLHGTVGAEETAKKE